MYGRDICECTIGAEHFWGKGIMMRNECVVGGIFMASNTANTCAVWNCSIRNNLGSTHRNIIGQQGSIEHLRSILGPPTKLLEANELICMCSSSNLCCRDRYHDTHVMSCMSVCIMMSVMHYIRDDRQDTTRVLADI